ncbi:MAG: acetylxylan esterase [Muribaculaceae bacterium]|nr:acetylxylan esterase [Muribaculaceae bacterium]
MRHYVSTLILALVTALTAIAQPRMTKVQLAIVPDHSDALYHCGEQAKMKITVLDSGLALDGTTIDYELSNDLMPPHISKSIALKGNETEINIGTMENPGFLRMKATVNHEGKKYTALSTVGFDVEQLQPTVSLPDDFRSFWEKNVEAAKKIELKPIMTLLPERCTDKVDVYHISYQNIGNSRMYGMLTIPKADGCYPGVLRFPGAGVGEKSGDVYHAGQGLIVLELGIHGIPVNLSGSVYSDLNRGALASYPTYNLDNKDTYFYKRVYLGCVRGIDFLQSLPKCNGRIGTMGGSQGGALSIVTSALDSRVNATAAYFPALCDLEGYIHGRAGGWPHVFKNESNRTPEKLNTARYYDVANFARHLNAPVHYLFGYNDLTCAPTTTRATYNAITAPKTLIVGENIGHWTFPEQISSLWDQLISSLKEKQEPSK